MPSRHRRIVGRVLAGVVALCCAESALALGKPDWAKPFLALPSPTGTYIAKNDSWVVVYGEVTFALRGERSVETRYRVILENVTDSPQLFEAVLAYDEGAQDLHDFSLNVQRTLWHEINLARKAVRASVAQGPQVVYASAESIEPHRRVVLEYTVADRLGVTPWAVAYAFRSEPVCRMRYSVEPQSAARGLQLELLAHAGAEPRGFSREADGSWIVSSVPAASRLRTSGLVYQPAVSDLFPCLLASIAIGKGGSFREFAAYYNDLWNRRAAEIGAAEVKARADALTRGAASQGEQVARLARFVQHDIQYDASRATSADSWLPIATQETLRAMKADCKGKAMLAQALFRAVGVEAVPVLLRSESDYFEWGDRPGAAFIDHVILAVRMPPQAIAYPATLQEGPAKGWVLFDPTVETSDFGEPLPGFEGFPALYVGTVEEPVFTIRTATPSVARSRVEVRVTLEDGGALHGRVSARDNGFSPLVARLALNRSEDEIRRELAEGLAEDVRGVRVPECARRKAGDDPSGATALEFTYTAQQPLQRMGGEAILENPLAVAAIVTGLPRGFAAGVPAKPEDAARLEPPWDAKMSTTGMHGLVEIRVLLALPGTLAFKPPAPRHERRPWLSFDLAWSPDGEHAWRGDLRLETVRGNWPQAGRKERLALMDALYTDLYAPLIVETAASR